MTRWWSAVFQTAVITLSLATTMASAGDCDPEAMEQNLVGCGFDFVCIGRVTAEFNAGCMGQPATTETSPEMPSVPATADEEMDRRIAECGMDLGCLSRLMQEAAQGGANAVQAAQGPATTGMPSAMEEMMQNMQGCGNDPDCLRNLQQPGGDGSSGSAGGGGPDFDTTSRIGESTILPASWLQSYQEALVSCGNRAECLMALFMGAGQSKVNTQCGNNMMDPQTAICKSAALAELHIEQAIAQQRLRQQNITSGRGATPAEEATPSTTPAEPTTEAGTLNGTVSLLNALPEISQNRVNQILSRWEIRLEQRIQQEGRDKIASAASAYPLESDPGTPPLTYEETEDDSSVKIDAKPTRRDWAYSLIGTLLTDAGMEKGGTDGDLLLNSALWSLIQAAKLKPEAVHFSNIGFHLNLRGKVDDARDILIHARKLEPKNADTDNNLAYSYSALDNREMAEALQQNAVRLDPQNDHIRSRLNAMLGLDESTASHAHGGDFGEAFFRLSKRHALREYRAGAEWQKERDLARKGAFGGTPPVPGAYTYYKEQVHDINGDYRACAESAPKPLRGCPHGAFILHPDCKNAPDPEQVERRRHNRNTVLCECQNNYIADKADAITAYLNASVQTWQDYEKSWWPRLNGYLKQWSKDIRNVNALYPAGSFHYPLESAYWGWVNEFHEDSTEAWGDDIPDIYNRWNDLKVKALKAKTCKSRLPPLEKKPKPPLEKPQEKTTTYGINLIVFKVEIGMNGDFKAAFDLGIIKGGYERNAATNGHKFTVGSGPIDVSYDTNTANGRNHGVTMTVGANFFKFIPGVGGVAGDFAGKFISLGSKHQVRLSTDGGYSHTTKVESQLKIGYSVQEVPGTRMNN